MNISIKILLFWLISVAAAAQTVKSEVKVPESKVCIDSTKADRIAKDLLKKENIEQQNENLSKQLLNYETMSEEQVELRRLFEVTIYSQQTSIENLTTVNTASVNLLSGIKNDIDAFRLSYYNKNIELEKENKELSSSNKRKTKVIVILSGALAAVTAVAIAF